MKKDFFTAGHSSSFNSISSPGLASTKNKHQADEPSVERMDETETMISGKACVDEAKESMQKV